MLRSKGVNEHLRIKRLNKPTGSLKTCNNPTNILEGNQRVNKCHLDGSPYARRTIPWGFQGRQWEFEYSEWRGRG